MRIVSSTRLRSANARRRRFAPLRVAFSRTTRREPAFSSTRVRRKRFAHSLARQSSFGAQREPQPAKALLAAVGELSLGARTSGGRSAREPAERAGLPGKLQDDGAPSCRR